MAGPLASLETPSSSYQSGLPSVESAALAAAQAKGAEKEAEVIRRPGAAGLASALGSEQVAAATVRLLGWAQPELVFKYLEMHSETAAAQRDAVAGKREVAVAAGGLERPSWRVKQTHIAVTHKKPREKGGYDGL